MRFPQEPAYRRLIFLATLFRMELVKDPEYQKAGILTIKLYYQPLT